MVIIHNKKARVNIIFTFFIVNKVIQVYVLPLLPFLIFLSKVGRSKNKEEETGKGIKDAEIMESV